MYRWLWQKLPGGKIAKSAGALFITMAVIAALFFWGFPALDNWFAQSPIVQN
jgi:hypothetical protein